MYAMIATCIALVIWVTGLSYVTGRAEKKVRALMGQRKGVEGGGGVGGKVENGDVVS